MENWFKNKKKDEKVEDFVLLNENDKNLQDTDSIDVEKIAAELNKKSSKKVFKRIIALALAVVFLAVAVFLAIILSNPMRGYVLTAVAKGNIEKRMQVSGVLTAENRYEITSLVSGKVIESDFEVGDTVNAGDIIYRLDDTEARLSVERAKNEVNRASGSTGSLGARIYSTAEGIIKSLHIYSGANVSAGSVAAVIVKEDGTDEAVVNYSQGRVSMVNVRVGQSVSVGQIMASVDTGSTSSSYDVKSSEINLQAAERHLSNYTIMAPKSGVIVEKNIKSGDNVAMNDTQKPMMVIVDTSVLGFTFGATEDEVKSIKKGQAVVVKTKSLPDTEFEGVVSSVSVEGYTNDDGVLMFDVSVAISDAKELKSGMKIDAEVVVTSVKKVLIAPKNALLKSDGSTAMVVVKYADDETIPEKILTKSLENKLEYPDIEVPEKCVLLAVKYGAFDDNNVEILSGLDLSDIVIYKDKGEREELVMSEYISSYDYYDEDIEQENSLEIREDIEKELEAIMQNNQI